MTETQTGMDILCDAAGSDLLLGSFLTPPSPQEQGQQQQRTKRVKVANDDGSSPASPHICHICRRVYERADHLTRHLRSHENARPYQCSRCPKRFNRADLLTRHETTHDRDDGGKGRPMIRRSDRAAEACINCASSKAKCDDQKPCGRCRNKNLVCQPSNKRGSLYGTSDAQLHEPRSESPGMASAPADLQSGISLNTERRVQFPMEHELEMTNGMTVTPGSTDFVPQPLASDDMFYFNPHHNFYQDMDFTSWDMNFDSYTIPQVDFTGPSPQSSTASTSRHPVRDPTRGYAAFKRSPWLWEPKTKDSLDNEQQGLMFNEKNIAHSPAYEKILASNSNRLKMDASIRDKLFALVLSQHKHRSKIPSFPSLDLLNYLLQTHFVQDDYQMDSWIHSTSFDPSSAIPELIAAVVASGAAFIADPAIWQFGLALQEVVRMGLSALFESNNSKTRDLQCLQGFILELDIGLWSGFKRKMEMAESFLLPPMMRRAGTFSAPVDTFGLLPLPSDSAQELDTKWRKFVIRESWKRLSLHTFLHDAQASITLQHHPLMSYTELCFCLPASRDLWRAPTAEAWREIYLRKKPLAPDTSLPRVSDIMHSVTLLDSFEEFVDIELCYGAVLYGFWGQIHAYREAVKFYDHHATASGPRRDSRVTHRLWLTSQHQELYRDVSEFAMLISSSPKLATQLSVVAELFMMILHVSPDELQRFAGKHGEDEARQVAGHLEDSWASSRDARHAVWHAGQVIRNARTLPPASLRGFNATAVYFASLTLWIYGLLSCSNSTQGQATAAQMPAPPTYVLVDGSESRETRAFLQLDKGTPGISTNGDVHSGVESLSNPGMVLNIARNVLRDNYPMRAEPLPPLVESLGNLMRDLGTGLAGRASRVQSRAVSEDGES